MTQILVIEDDKMIARSIQIVLSSSGYEVRLVESGEAGMADLEEQVPDVLMTDMSLPGMGGADVIKAAREKFPRLKIMAMSGDEPSLAVARSAGADKAIEKPFASDDFLEALEGLLVAGDKQ